MYRVRKLYDFQTKFAVKFLAHFICRSPNFFLTRIPMIITITFQRNSYQFDHYYYKCNILYRVNFKIFLFLEYFH